MKKYEYILQGLECPNCARKIQENIRKQDGISEVVVNFNTLTLSFKSEKDRFIEVKHIVKKLEPWVKVISKERKIEQDNDDSQRNNIIRFGLGVLVAIISIFVKHEIINNILVIFSYILLMYRTFKVAIKKIFKSKVLDENTLICISAIGAYLISEPLEGIMVLALYELGKLLEAKAVNNTRKNIQQLMNIRPEYANLKVSGKIKKVSPDKVNIGDIIVVKAGEKIPLDGVVITGKSNINSSALTGESKYISVDTGDKVLSGSINVDGLIEIKVEKLYVDSTVSKILELTENATDRKAKTENVVAIIAKYYVPTVLILAVLVAVFLPLISDITYSQSIYRGLIFLVISCPCAIAISVPLSYFCGIGRASASGILVKGSDYLDALRNIKTIVMDKTGTITTGKFSISKVNVLSEEYNEDEVLKLCKIGESFSNHPIAVAIVGKEEVDATAVKNHKELSGLGVSYVFDGKNILVGNNKLVEIQEENSAITKVYVSVNGEIIGSVELEDSVKEEAKELIQILKNRKISVKMFTGDNSSVAKKVGEIIGIEDVSSQMLPEDKYKLLEEAINNKSNPNDKIAFVGDGINDSPVLALADIGISMGGVGSNSAIEASDVVIMTDNLKKIIDAIEISKFTNSIIIQNLIFAIGVKTTFLMLSALGLTGMAFAIFADVGVTVLTILNSIRVLRKKN